MLSILSMYTSDLFDSRQGIFAQAKPVTLAAVYVGFKTFCWTFVGSMLIGQCIFHSQWTSSPCDSQHVQQQCTYSFPVLSDVHRYQCRVCIVTGIQDARAAL